jgi:Ca-activated chloride channel homolog
VYDGRSFMRGFRAVPPFLLAALLAPAAPPLSAQPAERPPIPEVQGEVVDVNWIELFAVATRWTGKPVRGLGQDDFRVHLDGEELPIQRVQEAADVPLVLGLVVDSSSSMGPVIDETRQAAHRFLDGLLAPGDRALLVEIDTRSRLVHGLTGDADRLASAFEELEIGGDTALYDAIALGVTELSKVPGRRALVVLSDGLDIGSRWGSREVRRLAGRAGVPVYFLSITGNRTASSSARNNLLLSAFARETGGDLYWIVGPDELGRAYDALEDELRNQYVLGVTSDRLLDEDELAGIEIEVRGRRGLEVRAARRGVN